MAQVIISPSNFQMVEEIFNHQDQMARVADRCLMYEDEDGYAGYQVGLP